MCVIPHQLETNAKTAIAPLRLSRFIRVGSWAPAGARQQSRNKKAGCLQVPSSRPHSREMCSKRPICQPTWSSILRLVRLEYFQNTGNYVC